MKRNRTILITIILALLVVILSFIAFYFFGDRLEELVARWRGLQKPETEQMTEVSAETEAVLRETEAETEMTAQTETEDPALAREHAVYTFCQGPVAWSTHAPYSGEWCDYELDGGLFSVFGCGLCAMANISSTFTPYECSPLDMYWFARKVSDYSPGGGAGAIDWPFMEVSLEKAGFGVSLREKDKDYRAFQNTVAHCPACIALISSTDDDTYWQDTPGHYVTIWLYNYETDEVFLGDSGNPDHNRSWIPLRYIYDALAHDSSYQYLTIDYYDDNLNGWQYSGIVEDWTAPYYYKPKPLHESLLKQAS